MEVYSQCFQVVLPMKGMKMEIKKSPINFDLEDDIKQDFEEKAKAESRSMAGQIRYLIIMFNEGRIQIKDPS